MAVEKEAKVVKPDKNKPLAVTLAILFGYWSWLYTSRFDAWKFFLGLVTHIAVIVVGAGIFAIIAWALWFVMIIAATINQATRSQEFFGKYNTSNRKQLSTTDIVTRVVVSLVVFGIFVAWQASVTKNILEEVTQESDQVSQQQEPSPVGSSVRDADFEFRVNSFECGHESIAYTDIFGESDAKVPQNGQFCILDFRATNIGSTPESISSSDQAIISSRRSIKENEPIEYRAKEYLSDDVANHCSYESVAPSTSINCKAYFDIPVDEDIVHARFHADLFSNGNVVKLR